MSDSSRSSNSYNIEWESNEVFQNVVTISDLENLIPESDKHKSQDREDDQKMKNMYKQISDTLDIEEKRLLDLEEKRIKLKSSMDQLLLEIEYEKNRIWKELGADREKRNHHNFFNDETFESITTIEKQLDPLSINTEEIRNQIQEIQEFLEDSKRRPVKTEEEMDINRLKANLATYKQILNDIRTEKVGREKRKAAAKMIQKQLKDIDWKCVKQIDKISEIQKNIGEMNSFGDYFK